MCGYEFLTQYFQKQPGNINIEIQIQERETSKLPEEQKGAGFYSSEAGVASFAASVSGAPESGPRTSSVVALSEDLTSAATVLVSALDAAFLGTDLETFLAGLALAVAFFGVDSARAFLRRAK